MGDRGSQSVRYAAIDLGTNTCLLLVAQWDGLHFVSLAEELRIIRLGAGVDEKKELSDDAMARTEAVFHEYKKIIAAHNCERVTCVATSAFREAMNREELRRRISQATGYTITEISGQEEAELVHKAVMYDFPLPKGRRIIVDVGGGSTELILETNGNMENARSLPLGSVRLTERWLTHDPPLPQELKAMERDIHNELSKISPELSAEAVVGVGGTATTFAAMLQQLDIYDHNRIHGAPLTKPDLQKLLDQCIALPLDQRLALPGLHPGRAEVIIAGGFILLGVMRHFQIPRMVVSDRGLRWGLVVRQAQCDSYLV